MKLNLFDTDAELRKTRKWLMAIGVLAAVVYVAFIGLVFTAVALGVYWLWQNI